jgi:hypothetical protein
LFPPSFFTKQVFHQKANTYHIRDSCEKTSNIRTGKRKGLTSGQDGCNAADMVAMLLREKKKKILPPARKQRLQPMRRGNRPQPPANEKKGGDSRCRLPPPS